MERRAISITQACESVGVSRRTIYNWMAAGKVQYVRTAGGAVRIFEDSCGVLPKPRSSSRASRTATNSKRRIERRPVVESLPSSSRLMSDPVDLRELFHRLNNELGVILAHAELLQVKSPDPAMRARATLVVEGALNAMTTAREIREQDPNRQLASARSAERKLGPCSRRRAQAPPHSITESSFAFRLVIERCQNVGTCGGLMSQF